MEKRRWILTTIFILLQILVILRSYFNHNYSFFWYCDIVPILFAFSFFTKNWQMAKGIINIGLLGQLIFVVQLTYMLITGHSLFTIAIGELSLSNTIITYFLHLSALAVLIFSYKIKPNKKSLIYSLGFLIVLYTLTLIFTSAYQNINNVYSSDILSNFDIPHYTQLWIFLAFGLVVLPTYFLQHLIYKIFH